MVTEYMDLNPEFLASLIDSFSSWHYWAWRGYDCCHREYGIIDGLGEVPTPDHLDQNILHSIVQPYPRAMAGTPVATTFDFNTATYDLEYSPRSIEGSTPIDPDLTTEIIVPERHYPRGYVARVANGRVVSEEDSPLLEIVAETETDPIVVEIRPK